MIRRYNAQRNAVAFPNEQDEFSQGDFAESVVDKSFFRPEQGIVNDVTASLRKPLYDYVGTTPESFGINLGWLRSKARDVTEIDAALESVKDTVDAAKKRDKANIEELKKVEKSKSDLVEVIKSASKVDSGSGVASTSQADTK